MAIRSHRQAGGWRHPVGRGGRGDEGGEKQKTGGHGHVTALGPTLGACVWGACARGVSLLMNKGPEVGPNSGPAHWAEMNVQIVAGERGT